MRYSPNWRKAIVFSVIFHILFLGSVGWLSGRFFATVESEPYIELELLTDTSFGQLPPSESAPQTTQVMKSAISHTPKIVAVADELAVEEAFSQSTSNNEPASNSSVVNSAEGSGNGDDGKGSAGGTSSEGNSGKKRNITAPRISSKVEPTYPEGARKAGLEGTAVVRIQILVNGLPGVVTIHTTSGHDMLDDAAIAAVKKWRFIPAKNQDSGASVMCYTIMPISFGLR